MGLISSIRGSLHTVDYHKKSHMIWNAISWTIIIFLSGLYWSIKDCAIQKWNNWIYCKWMKLQFYFIWINWNWRNKFHSKWPISKLRDINFSINVQNSDNFYVRLYDKPFSKFHFQKEPNSNDKTLKDSKFSILHERRNISTVYFI